MTKSCIGREANRPATYDVAMSSTGSISKRPSPLSERHAEYVAQLAAQGAGAAAETDRPNAATGHRRSDVGPEMIAYGVVDQTAGDASSEIGTNEPVAIVGSFDALETEYAALRRGAGIMDWPQRATITIEGADRLDFLNRLMTQQLKDLANGEARESFLINRKGRVIADVLVIEMAGRVLMDVDIFQAAAVVKTLEEFLFSEDVQIREEAGEMYHLELHGPKAAELLTAVSGEDAITKVENLRANAVAMAGKSVVLVRRDQIGESGFVLLVERDDAVAVWDALLESTKSGAFNNGEVQYIRPVGWFAWNIARIEAGTPMMNIDFDATCLPHETSLVKERVSFRKGCYPGQEIVARMENLGKPSKKLVGLRVAGEGLPVAGSDVYPRPKEGEADFDDAIGVITSSTLSPMLSAQPIALAMVKTKDINDGDTVMVMADGAITEATVGPMRFWSR